MKLANALSQRSELQTRIHQLEARLYNNAQVQEARRGPGGAPPGTGSGLCPAGGANFRHQPHQLRRPDGGRENPVRSPGPAGLLKGKAGDSAELPGKRQRPGSPPHRQRNSNSKRRGRPDAAKNGGRPVQGAAGIGGGHPGEELDHGAFVKVWLREKRASAPRRSDQANTALGAASWLTGGAPSRVRIPVF